jgi:hypothetical protein
MKAIRILVTSAMYSFVGIAAASGLVVLGSGELKGYVVGDKGRTFTIEDGERITFFTDGTFVNCSPRQTCDKGTYAVEASKIMRTYENWLVNGSKIAPIIFRRDGGVQYFNIRKIVDRTDAPELQETEQQFLASTRLLSTAQVAPEELAKRRQRSAELLMEESIKIEAIYRIDEAAGNPIARNTLWTQVWEALPLAGSFRYYLTGTGSPCLRGELKATFSTNPNGLFRVEVISRLPECANVAYLFDPISQVGVKEGSPLSGTKIRLLQN